MGVREVEAMRERLGAVDGLADTLAVSWDCFELMQALTDKHADQDPGMFAAFMFAAASATEGRDAIGLAPSLPSITGPSADHRERDPGDPGKLADSLVGLTSELGATLLRAARQASDPGDRRACEHAARQASRIGELLAG
jgi:hypothetical protein